jgi:hypothetical protein
MIGTGDEPTAPAPGNPRAPAIAERILAGVLVLVSLALIAYKFLLTTRLNVNWDEFLYLSNVYALARGELKLIFQGGYTHLFQWLTDWPGDEMAQIVAARAVMVSFLAVTALLLWQLGRRWLSGLPLATSVFVYLSFIPVLMHGGSFRADSILVLLSLAALVLLLTGGRSMRRDAAAGILLGASFAVTIKVVLFAPMVAAAIWFREPARETVSERSMIRRLRPILLVAAWVAATAVALLFAHWLSVRAVPAAGVADFGSRAVRKAVMGMPLLPQRDTLLGYLNWQPLHWLLILLGTVSALWRRKFDIAILSLALLPVVFYRNAFAYFYVVMLAPASLLAGFAVMQLRDFVQSRQRPAVVWSMLIFISAGLLYQGLRYSARLHVDEQAAQRMLLQAVHQVFPQSVNYIDRCGMISSFRKVNFFMSTWGMETYRAGNQPFMRNAIRDRRPAFVLVNSPYLNPNQRLQESLMPEDYEVIARNYPQYWGPIRVAGASAEINGTTELLVTTPFPADYRIRTDEPILVDGIFRADGEVIFVPETGIRVAAVSAPRATEPVLFQLFLATAQAPPNEQPPELPLFSGL